MAKDEDLLAELFLDLKGPKKKRSDWITIAKKCKKAVEMFGSLEKAAEKLGVSYELLRSITTLLTLPNEVQALVREKKILYDAAQRLYRINDRKKQTQVAKAMAGLRSHQQREIIQYAVKYPNANIQDFGARVAKPEKTREKIHVIITPLREETYRVLARQSSNRKISIEKLILQVLDNWVENRG
jgi:hypothetical protein